MNTKMTLIIEQTIIEKAKIYAKGKGTSLSDIIENYLKMITNDEDSLEIAITPKVKSLKSSFKVPSNYKKELAKGLSKKYL